jgi:hypothetical protein
MVNAAGTYRRARRVRTAAAARSAHTAALSNEEQAMKNKMLLAAMAALVLTGCVVAPAYDDRPPHRGGHGERDRDWDRDRNRDDRPPPPRSDRDRDGVPDRFDRRPNDPRRY